MKLNLRKMYRNMSPAVRTSFWFTICNFLQRGIALFTVPVFTRLLTTQEYGICNVYFTWAEIFIVFTSLQIPYEGLNNGLIRYEEDKDGYTSAAAGLILVITLLVSGVYLLLRNPIDRMTGLNGMIMKLMFIQLLFNPPLMLWLNRERFDFRYRWPVAVTVISTVLNPVISIIAVCNTRYKAEARIIGSVLTQSFFGFLVLCMLIYRGKVFFKKEYWHFALRFNLPLIFYYLSQLILNQADRVMINFFEGSGKAALYSMAYTAATIMMLLVSAVNGTFAPWMYRKLKQGQAKDIRRVAGGLCFLIAGATLAMSAFAPDLLRIMATEEYREAIWIIPPVSASVFFIFLYMMFANVEMYFDENRGILVISIVCSVANLILNGIFIPVCGYMAAGWTTLFCYGLLTIFHYLLMKRARRKNRISDAIFPGKLFLAVSFCVIGLSCVILVVYRWNILRYGILILEAGVLLILRKKLAGMWRQMGKGDKKHEK